MMRVPITRPVLGAEEADAVAAVLSTGMLVQGLLFSEPVSQRVAQLGPAIGRVRIHWPSELCMPRMS